MSRCGIVGTSALLVLAPVSVSGAADMPLKARPPTPAPLYTWTGFYFGGNAGYVRTQNTLSAAATPVPDATLGVAAGVSEGLAALSSGSIPVGSGGGFIGGGQLGYNLQLSSFWVGGIETDIQGLSGSGSGSTTNTVVVVGVPVTSTEAGSMSTKYLGTVRGRLGVLASPTYLIYGTGGLAYGGVNASASLAQSGTNGFVGAGAAALSDTRVGWTAGGGIEWIFARNWSGKVEYLHYDLGGATFASTPTSTLFAVPVYQTVQYNAAFKGDVVRGGINFHF
jgi:outer membrane immunogenic protein